MKNLYTVPFFLLLHLIVLSQTTPPYKPLSSYTQPAPNVAALGKYVDYPVGYYTGTPNISIPLFELKDGGVNLPISLSYHASGIRVSELASWIGLGWALNAGGMISRSVRGTPDEGDYGGYFKDSGIRKMPLLPYPVNGVIPSNNDNAEIQKQYYLDVLGGYTDTEPDLFCFNFNGYSGKFVFDENQTPTLLEEQDLKINVYPTNGTFSWMITTPDGIRYYFGENSMYEVSSVYGNEQLDKNSGKPSSWCLTKIINPNTKDTISFTYTPEVYSYYDLGSETEVYDQPSGIHGMQNTCAAISATGPTGFLRTQVSGLRLTNIKSRNYSIVFLARTVRQDLISYADKPFPYQLDSIKVFNAQSQCIKQFLLTHNYFNSTTATKAAMLGSMNNDVSDAKRLKLISVKEFSGDGSLAKPAYVISYQEAIQLPRRLSYDQDHWGYSNNYTGNANDRFMPRVEHPICFSYIGPYANRNPKFPDMQAYTIKSIKDPLGATTTFEFEAHTSAMMSPSNMVGGLRVHQITVTDSVTGTSQVRTFDYAGGGTLYNIPTYLIATSNEYYIESSLASTDAFYAGYGFGNSSRAFLKQAQSVVPLQDFQGNHIGYPKVKEMFGNNGEGGYKEHYFMADNYLSTSRLDMANYTATATIQTQAGIRTGLYGNGHFNDIPPTALQYLNSYAGYLNYPYAPLQVDLRRGKLLREATYDSAGNAIRVEQNNYQEVYDETPLIRGFKLFRSTGNLLADGSNNNNDALTYYKLHTGISRLISKTVTDYKDSKAFATATAYGYESQYHTLPTNESTVNSLGDTIISKTYYSFDYASNATADNVFAKMKSRNLLLPVATRQWKNKQLISGTITQYKDFASASIDTFINPSRIYVLETTNPLTTTQAAENIALTGQLSKLVPNSYFSEKANFNFNGSAGKIMEQKAVNNKNETLIWDNQYNLPIAKVTNAYFNEVAYSGFETSEKGNWTYTLSAASTDTTAPTGSRVYTLSTGNPISKSGLTASKTYILSYWSKSGASVSISGGTQSNALTGRTINNWTYREVKITGTTNLSISGSGGIDEVQLYPYGALMSTYTYDPLLRMTETCSPDGTINYYEYDSFSRLTAIKDQYGNIIKAFDYNYGRLSRAGQ